MRISPITISTNYKMHSFKANEQQKPQQQDVEWSTWGDNYAYPTTKIDESILPLDSREIKNIVNKEKEIIEKKPEGNHQYGETPEEYYRRKLYSTEWTM